MDEKQLRPPKMMADKKGCIEADQRFLLNRRDEWANAPCPACGHDAPSPFGIKDDFGYDQCSHCQTVYINPRPSQALIHDFYANSQNYAYWSEHIFPATAQVRRKKIFAPRAQLVADLCRDKAPSGSTLMEVGAAYGLFCEEIAKLNFFERVIAVEPTPELAQHCRNLGLEVIEAPVETIKETSIADVVAAFEVIEHLHSPRGFIEGCADMLKPDGLLILSCPNAKGFDMATLDLQCHAFNHEHLNYFHPESLTALLKDCGLEVLEVRTPGALDAGIVRGHVLDGNFSLEGQPLLQDILVDRWDELGGPFQEFLAQNGLSSHMMVIARKV